MKLMTLNTHSLLEENCEQKLEQFVESILRDMPDLIALQEVNQSANAEEIPLEFLEGQFPVPGYIKIRRDNYAAAVAYRLNQAGVKCYWAWMPIKRAYGKFDEGVALISLNRPITSIDHFPISRTSDYQNWHTRAVLGVKLDGLEDWFYSVHLGWWDETEDSFQEQWRKLQCCIACKRMCSPIWLLGDFNAPDSRRDESYDMVVSHGWMDSFRAASNHDRGITVPGVIDGWSEERVGDGEGMRLDYILCSRIQNIKSSRVAFNGLTEPVISDHYGVIIEVERQ